MLAFKIVINCGFVKRCLCKGVATVSQYARPYLKILKIDKKDNKRNEKGKTAEDK